MSDKPLFDPLNAHKGLIDAFDKKQRSGRRVTNVLEDTHEEITTINREYAGDLNRFSRETDRISDGAMEAMDRLEAIDSNPAVVNRVMSLFDSNYSRTAQERKLQRSQWEQARLSNQLKTNEDMRALRLQEAGQELQLAEHLYQFDQQGFLDQANLMELGFQVEAQINQRTADLAKNASLDQLTKWRQDPKSAPSALKGKPGLIELAYFEKKSSEQGLRQGEQMISMNQQLAEVREYQIQDLRQQRSLAEMDDQTLSTALRNRKLPDGVSYGAAADEWERRQQVDYGLIAAQQAAELGNIQVEGTAKQFALSKMTTDQIQTLQQIANQSKDGTAGHGKLKFTSQELENAYTEAHARDIERQQARNDVFLGLVGLEGQQDHAQASINSVAALTNPGGVWSDNPVDTLPPAFRARVRGTMQQANVAMNLPNGAPQAAKKLEELQIMLDDYAKEQIASKPKEQQPAYQEYYDNGGLINNPQAAADYLVQALPNPTLMAHDLTYGAIWEQLSESYLEIAGQDLKSLEVDPGSGGLVISETDKANNVDVLEKAVRGVRDQAVGTLFQSYTAETVIRMQQRFNEQLDHQRDGLNIWNGIVNPNTLQFTDAAYSQDAQGNKVFDLGRFSQYLAAKTYTLREKGVLQPGESLNQLLENALRRNVSGFVVESGSGSIEKAAMQNILFGNNTATFLNQAVHDFGNQTDTTLAVAAERAQQIQEQISNFTRQGTTTTGGLRRQIGPVDPATAQPGPAIPNNDRSFVSPEPGDDLIIQHLRQRGGQ